MKRIRISLCIALFSSAVLQTEAQFDESSVFLAFKPKETPAEKWSENTILRNPQTYDTLTTELHSSKQSLNLPEKQKYAATETETEKNESLSADFEIRQRTEYRNGYSTLPNPSDNPALLCFQRTRAGINYSSGKITTAFHLQDVRTWGESKAKLDAPSVGVYEAWLEVRLNDYSSLKLGRQSLKYDDQRFLSNTDWNNVATSHDLALLKLEKGASLMHLGLAYNNDKDKLFENNYPVDFYKAMQFLYASKKFENGISISLLEIVDGYQKAASNKTVFFRNTAGLNAGYKTSNGKFEIAGSGYKQGGTDKTGNKINANFYSLKASFKMNSKFTLSLGNDHYSGTNNLDTANTINGAFNNLFGSGHAFCGYMDYFTVVDAHTKAGGLSDSYAKLFFTLGKNASIGLDYHYFVLANNVIDTENLTELSSLDKSLGSEFDLTFIYKVEKNFVLKMGYSTMFATKSMSAIKGGDFNEFADWAYVSLTFTPKAVLK